MSERLGLMSLPGILDQGLDLLLPTPDFVLKWKVWLFWIELHASKLVPEVHLLLLVSPYPLSVLVLNEVAMQRWRGFVISE